jgi:trans-aconitate methyltransferase
MESLAMGKIAPRFPWTIAALPLQPDHHVMEVGCGHGIAVGLIGERLTTGTITGVDRSAKMIDAASKRNADLIEADQVVAGSLCCAREQPSL